MNDKQGNAPSTRNTSLSPSLSLFPFTDPPSTDFVLARPLNWNSKTKRWTEIRIYPTADTNFEEQRFSVSNSKFKSFAEIWQPCPAKNSKFQNKNWSKFKKETSLLITRPDKKGKSIQLWNAKIWTPHRHVFPPSNHQENNKHMKDFQRNNIFCLLNWISIF